MIPKTNDDLINDVKFEEIPTNTFKLDISKNRIAGMTDGLEAMVQAVYLILNTERYRYLIYSWNYGVQLEDLIGKPTTLVIAELQRKITEALLQDSRITAVENFSFEKEREKVHVYFTVKTIYGDVETEKVVEI